MQAAEGIGYHGGQSKSAPSKRQNKSRPLVIVAVLTVLASGCISVYRPDQQQGNVVTADMAEKLKPGMTRSQVRFVLGTPLVVDAFRDNRWDYPFRLKRGDGTVTSSHVAVIFDQDGRVASFEGGDLPEEKEYLQRLAAPKVN